MSGDYTEGASSAVNLREQRIRDSQLKEKKEKKKTKVSSILPETLDCPKAISA